MGSAINQKRRRGRPDRDAYGLIHGLAACGPDAGRLCPGLPAIFLDRFIPAVAISRWPRTKAFLEGAHRFGKALIAELAWLYRSSNRVLV
jgi:hypothetical protein